MKRFFSALLCVILLCSLPACSEPEQKLFEEVVTKTETGYAFAGMDWSVTKAEAMKQLNVTPETVERDLEDRFTIAVYSDELGAAGHATYVFVDKDNQLCGGWYYFPIDNMDETTLCAKVKAMAQEWLGEPENRWEELLESSIRWVGSDESLVSLNVDRSVEGQLSVLLSVGCPPLAKEDLLVPPSE